MKIRSYKIKNSFFSRGFTLIEIVVALAVLGTLIGGALIAVNPNRQLNKTKDAASQAALQEVKKGLDLYYQDSNCYPTNTSSFTTALSTGGEWKVGNTVYLAKTPVDGYGRALVYMTDPTSSCPQWNVLFTKLSAAGSVDICPLQEKPECTPEGFDNTWACVVSGSTNCSAVSGGQIGIGGIVPTATPSATPVPPTPTPDANIKTFSIAIPASAKPQFFTGTIKPINPASGEQVEFSVNTDGYINPSPVTSVVAQVKSDNQTVSHPLTLESGTAQNGKWSATWTQQDSTNGTFQITVNSQDADGNQSSFDVSIR